MSTPIRRRVLNILVSVDSLVASLGTLGAAWPAETISSMAYRAELHGMHFRHARPFIDWLLSWLEKDHCKLAYEYARMKRNLPEDMRN